MNDTVPMAPPPRADLQAPAGPLFDLGQMVATRGVLAHLQAHPVTTAQALVRRHVTGDFGDLSGADRQANLDAIQLGDRILSAYAVAGERLYVITEHDRSVTTVLLASEY
jgi:hypothetical protein